MQGLTVHLVGGILVPPTRWTGFILEIARKKFSYRESGIHGGNPLLASLRRICDIVTYRDLLPYYNKSMRRSAAMEKRCFERIPVRIDFRCFKKDCFGTIVNLSESGMFINSHKIDFPFESQFSIIFPFKNEMLSVRVKVKRLNKSGGYYDGIGVELVDRSSNYLKFVNYLKSSKN